jgi:drug/metabolite transporter (DMT)-like permease
VADATTGRGVSNASGSERAHLLRAQLWLTGAMMCWGINVPIAKYLTTLFQPILLGTLRMLIACLVFTGIVLCSRSRLPKIERSQWAILIVCGVLMVYLNQYFFATGIAVSSVTNTALISALGPLVSSLLAALAFRERLSGTRMLGIALGMGGVAAVILQRPSAGLQPAGFGEVMIFAGVLSFAIGGILVQRLARRMDSLAMSLMIHLAGTFFLVLHSVLTGVEVHELFPGGGAWGLLLFSGIFATALANLLWNRSIAKLGVGRTALYLNWVPLFAIAAGAAFFGEPLSWWHGFGLLCVAGGTWLGSKKAA